ncbi:GntR family transcriptional regulator [Arsenicitalea aurantiaca]|uniref:GntR family transcriptional regulator n=1 Tax=Arsenicitalea aurantiaca TaxID=1783274 RepID=A0A433X7S2_9HYPH|nr:GntR family transcriptional regulator [Arsenicitalea aurantiaca]RUT30102.1 GntR family transcriptional regulator [Arsenicitalea aurantiaca]
MKKKRGAMQGNQEGRAMGQDGGGRRMLVDAAHDRLEGLIVDGTLAPGRFLSIQDLQTISGLSRTPAHQAVMRLAHDTLMTIHPRQGVRIAPIDLMRETLLLELRADMERFLVRLAADRASPAQRRQMRQIAMALRNKGGAMPIEIFNPLDLRIDRLILAAGGEPFLENTLRPLHTLFRRIGWLHHAHIEGRGDLSETVALHAGVLEAIAARDETEAVAASDRLIGYVRQMLETLAARIDPVLLDSSLEPLDLP